jgi:hypothetical protein
LNCISGQSLHEEVICGQIQIIGPYDALENRIVAGKKWPSVSVCCILTTQRETE